MEKIKETYIEIENKEYDSIENETDVNELKEKVMFLEKRLYQIIAGELSTKKVVKKDKKNNGQIMLFGEELLSVNDFTQTKEDVDFDDLKKKVVIEEKEEATIEEVTLQPTTIVEEKEEIIEEKPIEMSDSHALDEKTEYIMSKDEILKNDSDENVEQTAEPEMKGLFETEYIVQTQKVEAKEEASDLFDVQKNTETNHKESSILFVTEKKTIEERQSISQDIILQESDDKQVSEVVEVALSEKEVKEEMKVDKFAHYNIKDIEQILHDSRAIESKNDKVRIEQVWKNMTRGARPEYLSIIETLQEGKVAVVGNKEFIIVFPSVALCNIVMRRKFKDIAIRMLYNMLGDTYDYAALPIDVWTSKSREYKEQYQIGIKYPTLKPLNVPGLEIVSEQNEFKTKNDRTIDKTIELFGKENIIIK